MAGLPIPNLNLNSNASSAARGDATFGGSPMSVNYGTQGVPAWAILAGVGLLAWLYLKRKKG